LILVAQDTTTLDYTSHASKKELGPFNHSKESRGLLSHSAIAMTNQGLPLGVIHLDLWTRDALTYGDSQETKRKKQIAEKESQKWIDGLHATQEAMSEHLSVGRSVLLIQDREADIFDFLAAPRRDGMHLLVRATHPRRVKVSNSGQGSASGQGAASNQEAVTQTFSAARRTKLATLFDQMTSSEPLGRCEVSVPRKPGQPERMATLEFRVQALDLQPPTDRPKSDGLSAISVFVVQAIEVDAPGDVNAISWTLISTLPVTTLEQAQEMVRYYTYRWIIERLHYTLKSGLQVERLQIDNAHALKNGLALYYIVAWRLLYLTYVARKEPECAVQFVVEDEELQVLTQREKKPVLTTAQAMTAIAKLGGYRPSPKTAPPGVKVLWMGLRRLDAMVEGWRLALRQIQHLLNQD
jgi:hypothetical protein